MYRVSVENGPEWRNYKRACLAISIGMSKFDGEKLAAIVSWINRNFEECIVQVADTLQRWNILVFEGLSESEARDKSLRLGSEWLDRNKEILNTITIPYEIIRWDSFLEHADYRETKYLFEKLYFESELYRFQVNQDIEIFLERRRKRGLSEIDRTRFDICLQHYISEEMAVDTLIGRNKPTAFIYPGSEVLTNQALRQGNVKGQPYGLQNTWHTWVEFNRLKTQHSLSAYAAA